MKTRHTKTKQKIVISFLNLSKRNPLSKITIKDITVTAGVSEPSFYNNFKNISDLINYTFNDIDKKTYLAIINKLHTPKNKKDAIELIFIMSNEIYKNKDKIRVAYNKTLYGQWKHYLLNKYSELIYINFFKTGLIKKGDINLKTASDLFTRTILASIQIWITKPVPESPEIFSINLMNILFTPYTLKLLTNNSEN